MCSMFISCKVSFENSNPCENVNVLNDVNFNKKYV